MILNCKLLNKLEEKVAINGSRYAKIRVGTSKQDNTSFTLNCWDDAYNTLQNIKVGDYIQCNVIEWNNINKYNEYEQTYKAKYMTKIEDYEPLGLWRKDTGVITSINVHEAAGKGRRTISFKLNNNKRTVTSAYKDNFEKTINVARANISQDEYTDLQKGDIIYIDGWVDPTITDRIYFKDVTQIRKVQDVDRTAVGV